METLADVHLQLVREVVSHARIAHVDGIVIRKRHQRPLTGNGCSSKAARHQAGIGVRHSRIQPLTQLQPHRRIDLIKVVGVGSEAVALVRGISHIDQPAPELLLQAYSSIAVSWASCCRFR